MRKLIYLSLCFLFLFPLLVFAQWEDAQISRLSYDSCDNGIVNLMEIDENDKIYLIYWQDPKPYTTNVTEFILTKEKGSDWSAPLEIGNPSFKNMVYGRHKFGIDLRNGLIHCIYAYGDTLYYTNDTLNWEVIVIDTTAKYGRGDNIQCDSLGNVHFSWSQQVGYYNYKVMYITNATGEWVRQELTPLIDLRYKLCRMAVEKGGRIHIIYYTPYFLYHIVNDSPGGTSWTKDSLAYPFYYSNEVGDFRIGKNNSLHMLLVGSNVPAPFQHKDFSVWYYYRHHTTGDWITPEQVTGMGKGYWLFLDNQGEPHVSWYNKTELSANFFANKKKGYWESTQLPENPHDPFAVRFVLDSDGVGYATFLGSEDLSSLDSIEVYYYGPNPGAVFPDDHIRPLSFELKQNYPNPFNPATTIPYTVYSSQFLVYSPLHTTLIIYNILGQKVRVLHDGERIPGEYQVKWDGKDENGKEVSSGIYFYVLKCGDVKETKKMLLIR